MVKRYAVEAKIYDDGRIDAFMRQAEPGEADHLKCFEKYDLFVEVFDTEDAALKFLHGYARGMTTARQNRIKKTSR